MNEEILKLAKECGLEAALDLKSDDVMVRLWSGDLESFYKAAYNKGAAELAQAKQDFKDVHEDYQSISKELHQRNLELEAVKKERNTYKQMVKEQWACPELPTCQKQRDELATELQAIADQDPVELMLDPQWAKRIAQATLAKLGADKTGEKHERD